VHAAAPSGEHTASPAPADSSSGITAPSTSSTPTVPSSDDKKGHEGKKK